jgi:hypothetical protein
MRMKQLLYRLSYITENLASRQGLEPRLMVLETIVLPLHQRDINTVLVLLYSLCYGEFWYPWVGTIHRPSPYQDDALPLSYMGVLVQPVGIEPTSMVLQTTAMTTSAKVALGYLMRIELIRRESQSLMLPLHHRHHKLAEVVRFELTARY